MLVGLLIQEHKGKWIYRVQQPSAAGWSLYFKSVLILAPEAEHSRWKGESLHHRFQSAPEPRRKIGVSFPLLFMSPDLLLVPLIGRTEPKTSWQRA